MRSADVGLQSYTYRRFPLRRAIEEAAAVGCRALEVFPGHLPADTPRAEVDAVLAHARAHGIRFCGYGVVGVGPDGAERDLRFAHGLGCDYVSIDVRPDDRAAQRAAIAHAEACGLRLGIHNHGPGHHYSTVDTVLAQVEGMPACFGACVDTGHFLRAGQDPVEAVVRLGARALAVHLKDFTAAGAEVAPGAGRLDLPATLRALARSGFSTAYVLEYEADEHDPTPAVRAAVAAVAAALQAV